MAQYSLNEVLKAREAQGHKSEVNQGEMHLDDVARVKVLSPGRKVFKRFMRNRLAVFGACLLITMFVFCFVGPLFYAYSQTRIFYTYEDQNINYAMVKYNETYNGYNLDNDLSTETKVVNAMNSNIKKMTEDQQYMSVFGESGAYRIEKLAEGIFTLNVSDVKQVASIGNSQKKVGTYNQLGKELTFDDEEIEGLAEAVAAAIKSKTPEFELGDRHFVYEAGQRKSYTIYEKLDGVQFTGASLGEGFEAALTEASEAKANEFEYGGKTYALKALKDRYDAFEILSSEPAKVYTTLSLDTLETGKAVSNEFRVNSLLAAKEGGSFTADGSEYSVVNNEGSYAIYDAAGNEYAELSRMTVRRYSGEDSMSFALKKLIIETVQDMRANNEKTRTIRCEIPEQDEQGSYVTDENGALQIEETDMHISRKETGEYVLNCDQTIYKIDRFGKPTSAHILGTDGDGFDVFARIMYGGRVSLLVGFVVVFLEIILGVIMGGLAGYYGKWVDMLVMRLVDIFYCLPSMPILIIIGAMMDAQRVETRIRLVVMIAALGIMGWAGVARMVRGQILSLREQEFMVAAEATGIKVRARIFRHLIPNVMPQLIVIATMGMGGTILTESTLSYLGLGVKHPLATWGSMINSVSSSTAMKYYPYIWIPVGILICLTVIAFNFVGDGLRDAYDPKSKN